MQTQNRHKGTDDLDRKKEVRVGEIIVILQISGINTYDLLDFFGLTIFEGMVFIMILRLRRVFIGRGNRNGHETGCKDT